MIKNWIIKQIYRKKSIAIIINNKNEFLVDQLVSYGENHWNFPGGGIEKDETQKQALLRELQEELGTKKFKILAKSDINSRYNWPFNVVYRNLIKRKKFYLGQIETYFLVKFIGEQTDIKPDPSEIRKIKWIKRSEFKKYLIFPNQVEITENVLKEYNTKL